MSTADRLLKRLREAGVSLPMDAWIRRVYPSRADRALGAWSWAVYNGEPRELGIGSQWPMTRLLREGFTVSEPDVSGDRHVDLKE